MAERLTEKITNEETGEVLRYRIKSCYGKIGDNRMKAIKKLGKLEDADEEGRLVVLPCKVGDTVYEIRSRYSICTPFGDRFNEYSCQGCYEQCDSKKEYIIDEYRMHILEDIVRHIRCNNFGKTIFTTREEAEKALKEMEGKNNGCSAIFERKESDVLKGIVYRMFSPTYK